MKKFKRHRTFEEVRDLCKKQGVPFSDHRHRIHGDDSVVVGKIAAGHHGYAIFNTFNGRFFGLTPDGEHFSSYSGRHDKQPWFQALLNFFYTNDPAPVKRKKAKS